MVKLCITCDMYMTRMSLFDMKSSLFVADGVNSFQGKKIGVVKQLKDKHAP